MTTILLILLVAGALAVLMAVAAAKVSGRSDDPAMQPDPVPMPEPMPVPEPRPDPVPAKPGRVTVRLVSAKGRKLKDLTLDSRHRKPKLTYELKPGQLSEFVADRKTPEGVWIYRRIHVERQA